MKLEQRRQAMLHLHLSDQQVYCLLRCVLYKRWDGKHSYVNIKSFCRTSSCLFVNVVALYWLIILSFVLCSGPNMDLTLRDSK